MKAFEINLNGERLYTAGIGEFGILTARIQWSKHDGDSPEEECLWISVRGECAIGGVKEDREWKGHHFQVGDEIILKVVETDQVDAPAEISRRETQVLPGHVEIEPKADVDDVDRDSEIMLAKFYRHFAQLVANTLYHQVIETDTPSPESLRENRQKLYERLRAEFEVKSV